MNSSNKYHQRTNGEKNLDLPRAAFASEFIYMFAWAKARDTDVDPSMTPPQNCVDGKFVYVEEGPSTRIQFIQIFVTSMVEGTTEAENKGVRDDETEKASYH